MSILEPKKEEVFKFNLKKYLNNIKSCKTLRFLMIDERLDNDTVKKIFILLPDELKLEIEKASKEKQTELLEFYKQVLINGINVNRINTLKEKIKLVSMKIVEFEKQIKLLESENDILLSKIKEVENDYTWLINRTEELEKVNNELMKKFRSRK
ncbi:MAG: hypothetical protein QW260_08180 [Thermoproteota archaeon]